MKEYLLILRDEDAQWDTYSPDQIQSTLEHFFRWNDELRSRDALVASGKLTDDLGVTLRSRKGSIVIDGPYSEAKEAVAGYYQIRAASIEEATEIAHGCPILTYGGTIEIRELDDLGDV